MLIYGYEQTILKSVSTEALMLWSKPCFFLVRDHDLFVKKRPEFHKDPDKKVNTGPGDPFYYRTEGH